MDVGTWGHGEVVWGVVESLAAKLSTLSRDFAWQRLISDVLSLTSRFCGKECLRSLSYRLVLNRIEPQ